VLTTIPSLARAIAGANRAASGRPSVRRWASTSPARCQANARAQQLRVP